MILQAAKLIGAGLSTIALAGVGAGIGTVSVSYTHLTLPTKQMV